MADELVESARQFGDLILGWADRKQIPTWAGDEGCGAAAELTDRAQSGRADEPGGGGEGEVDTRDAGHEQDRDLIQDRGCGLSEVCRDHTPGTSVGGHRGDPDEEGPPGDRDRACLIRLSQNRFDVGHQDIRKSVHPHRVVGCDHRDQLASTRRVDLDRTVLREGCQIRALHVFQHSHLSIVNYALHLAEDDDSDNDRDQDRDDEAPTGDAGPDRQAGQSHPAIAISWKPTPRAVTMRTGERTVSSLRRT